MEGSFLISIGSQKWELANDLREIYLASGYERTNLTKNIPFLNGYQGNICFYCGEPVKPTDIHVDHVLPRQVLNHDEIWNLVISHSYCNLRKEDLVVDKYYIRKLIARNENIMGSNHPWKKKIESQLGSTKNQRMKNTLYHYENVKSILGQNYWGGIQDYIPEKDEFYRKLITVINNKGL